MSTKPFYRRRFLNRRGFHAGAYVLADCALETFTRNGQEPSHSIDAEFTVSDCARIVTLDFCVHDEASAKNAVFKARQLRDTITDFTIALETTVEDWRKHEA